MKVQSFEYCQFINGGEYLATDVEGMLSVDSTSDETDRNFNLTVNQCTFDSSEVVAGKNGSRDFISGWKFGNLFPCHGQESGG